MNTFNRTGTNSSIFETETFNLVAGHLLLTFYCLIYVFGFFGNAAVIYVAIRKKKYRNVTNCYVVNLAIADLLFLTVSIPRTTYLGLLDQFPFGDRICLVYTYLAYVFLLATCYTLAVMSIDRYLYIVLPKGRLRWRTSKRTLFLCLLIWTISLILIVPYHIISHSLSSPSKSCSGSDEKNFLLCLFIFGSYYAIPLIIIIICYTRLALHVTQSNRLLRDHMQPKTVRKSIKLRKRQVTRMVIVVTLAFAVSWLPIHILELMNCAESKLLQNLIQSYEKLMYAVRAVSQALAYFNSCLNPYLYALLNRNFCFDLIDIIPSCFICGRTNNVINRRTCDTNIHLESLPNENLLPLKQMEDEDEDYYENNLDEQNFQLNQVENVDVSGPVESIALSLC